MSDHQDWQTVTLRGSRNKSKVVPKPQNSEAQRLYKLETYDAAPKKKRLTAGSRQALTQARIAIKKTQRDIDKELAFPPNTIRDFEAGTVAPSGPQISAMHRYFASATPKLVLKTEEF